LTTIVQILAASGSGRSTLSGGRVRLRLAVALLVLVPASAPAQGPALPSGWTFTLGADGLRFGRTALDTAVAEERAADLRPSRRVNLRATVARSFGRWRAQLEAGWAGGGPEVNNAAVSARDKTLDLSRLRFGALLERRASALGAGELALALGPTLDLWRAAGDNRVRFGLEGQVAVRVPLGPVALENRVTAGLSGDPLDQEDLGEGFERHGLRWLAVGLGLRVGL
jgi:hypothetical protein